MSEPQATGERASDAPHDVADDWVTVAEAARRLGIGERRAYRLASGLSDTDRRLSDNRRTLVRQSALSAAAGIAPMEAEQPPGVSDTVGQVSDKAPPSVGQVSDTALVEQLRSEVAYLRGALEREQENTRAALAQLADSDARLASVLAATGRVQLSEAPDATGTEASPNWSTPAGNGAETVEAPRPGEASKLRPWWRWWGK